MPAISRIAAAVCAATAATAALTGCNGDGSQDTSAPLVAPAATTSAKAVPFGDLTAAQLLDGAVKDMRAAGAMTAEMTGRDDIGSPVHVKAAVTSSGDCALAADFNAETLQFIGTGGAGGYLKGDEGFWSDIGDENGDAAARFAGKWTRLTQQEVTGIGLDHLCGLGEMLDDMTSATDEGTLRRSAPITLDGGTQVIPLVHSVSGRMTTIFVSTGATPYVVRSETGEEGDQVGLYSDFGKRPHISVPPHALTVRPGDLDPDAGNGGFHV